MAHLDSRGAAADESVGARLGESIAGTDTVIVGGDANTANADTVAAPIIVGKIAGQYGVKGWLKVHSFTRPPAQILRYPRWLLKARRDAGWRPVQVDAAREQAQKLLAKLAGVDDRSAAEPLAGQWIAIAESQLDPLPPGEYYWSDLIGLAVVNLDGVELGVVAQLIETGANDVLVVRDGDGATERLLPWDPRAIVEVELAAGRLRVDWDADWDVARAAGGVDTVATTVAD